MAPANLNTPSQIVCSGEEAGVVKLVELAEEAGADKAIKLQVGAAFHSEADGARPGRGMADEMEAIEWADPEVPLCSNAPGAESCARPGTRSTRP